MVFPPFYTFFFSTPDQHQQQPPFRTPWRKQNTYEAENPYRRSITFLTSSSVLFSPMYSEMIRSLCSSQFFVMVAMVYQKNPGRFAQG